MSKDPREAISDSYRSDTSTGNGKIAVTIEGGDESGLATETTLQAVLEAVDGLELTADNIDIDLDQVEVKLDTVNSNLDSIETKLDTANTSLDNIEAATQSIDNDIDVALSSRASEVTLQTAVNKLQDIFEAVDELELGVDNIDIDVDQVETLITSSNTKLDTVNTNLGTVQSSIASTNTKLDSIDAGIPTSLGQKAKADSMSVVIASDQPSLIQSSVPTMFSVSFNLAALTAGIDNPILFFRNPVGSGKNVYLHKMSLGCTVTNVAVEFKLFANPTTSANGTGLTIRNRDVGGAGTSTIALANSGPTVSVSGSQLWNSVIGQNGNSLDIDHEFGIKLNPNNSLLITANPSSNNRNVTVTLSWLEING